MIRERRISPQAFEAQLTRAAAAAARDPFAPTRASAMYQRFEAMGASGFASYEERASAIQLPGIPSDAAAAAAAASELRQTQDDEYQAALLADLNTEASLTLPCLDDLSHAHLFASTYHRLCLPPMFAAPFCRPLFAAPFCRPFLPPIFAAYICHLFISRAGSGGRV